MKNVKFSILIPILLIITQNCDDFTSTGFKFEHGENLMGKVLPITDSVYFRYPFRIRRSDSLVYILDLHGPDFYCHIFKYPMMTFVTSLAPRGNGPNEFLLVENLRVGQLGSLYLLDANKKTITLYNPNDTTYQRIRLPEDLIRCLDFTLINDSMFAIPDYTGKHRVNIVDGNGNIQKQLFDIPARKKNKSDASDITLAQAWRSFIDYNPDNGILAMATQLGQVIEIYNVKTAETINILYGKLGEPEYVKQGAYAIPNGIMGYSDLHVGKDKIYTVFWGTSFKDIRKNPDNRKEGGNIIQIFNLSGEPIIQYTLDRHITGFCIDEKDNRLLGLDVNNDQQIVEYQLPL